MARRSKYTDEEKFNILSEYEEGSCTISSLLYKYNICDSTFYDWQKKYKKYGLSGLMKSNSSKSYSKELKLAAVEDYLTGNYSQRDIAEKYKLSDHSLLRRWIKQYNSHREQNDTVGGTRFTMTKGRKTTFKERIEITENCIANDHDYNKTALHYNVSYQQVYTWVKKYISLGHEGLQDKRGKQKLKDELSAEELMELKLKKLEAENERLKAENVLLKKLEELEGRRF